MDEVLDMQVDKEVKMVVLMDGLMDKQVYAQLRPFATWPENNKKQPVGEMITEDKKGEEEERPWWKFWVSKDKKKEGEPFWKFWGQSYVSNVECAVVVLKSC